MAKILYKNWKNVTLKLKNNNNNNNKVYNKSVISFLSIIIHKLLYVNN